MNITITINTDNAAFCDEPQIEVARILGEISRSLEDGGAWPGTIIDFNGNAVGKFKIRQDRGGK